MRKLLLACVVALPLGAVDVLSVQAGTALPINQWVQVTPTGFPQIDVPGWEIPLMYVPAIDAACVQGNWREISGEANRTWACYSFRYNRIDILDDTQHFHNSHELDAGHPIGMSFDPVHSRVMGVCCNSGTFVPEDNRWNWIYDFVGQAWRQKKAQTGVPFGAHLMIGSYDPLADVLVVHGGDSGFTGTSEYNPNTNVWSVSIACTALNLAVCPTPGLTDGSFAYNSFDKQHYEFGGNGGGQATLNTVYKYTQSSHSWAAMPTTGTRPTARISSVWLYMPEENRFFMCCGSANQSGGAMTDSWIYDPEADTWTQITTTGTPPANGTTLWYRGAYFPDWGAVVILAGTRTGLEWSVIRARSGAKVGSVTTPAYSPTAGGQNANGPTSWAESPSISVNGSTIYQAWSESGIATNQGDSGFFRPYAQQVIAGVPTKLGGAYNSMDTASTGSESLDPRIGPGGTWTCWEAGAGTSANIQLKQWTGSAWTASNGTIAGNQQGGCDVTTVGSAVYVIYRQFDATSTEGFDQSVYVQKCIGTCSLAGATRLNIGATPTKATGEAITNDGTNVYAVWAEYSASNSINQIFAKSWNGTAWSNLGASANQDTSQEAFSPAVTYVTCSPCTGAAAGLYVGFLQRTIGGNSMLWVRRWTGSAWATVGSASLNLDQNTGWAYQPRLSTDGTNVYVTWSEQGWSQSQSGGIAAFGSWGNRPQIHVARWNGTAWGILGGSLNADTALGSAIHPDIATSANQPIVIWAEKNLGSLQQIYWLTWNGSDWTNVPASCTVTPSSLGPWTVGQTPNSTLTESGCNSSTFSLTGAWPTGISGCSSGSGPTCTLSGTISASGTFIPSVAYDTAAQPYTIIVNLAPGVSTCGGSSTACPAGTQGTLYTPQTIATTGGTSPVTCAGSGQPSGMSVNSTCTLSGTPTVAGSFTISITATDGNSISSSPKSFTLSIAASGPSTAGVKGHGKVGAKGKLKIIP